MPERVITIHGIRTRGKWQEELNREFAGEFDHRPFKYGFLGTLRFLVPSQRQKQLDEFMEEYADAVSGGAPAPHVIAHSFGTYLVAKALLQYPGTTFGRVILCGSIIDRNFPWDEVVGKGLVESVLNDHSRTDPWPRVAGWVVRDAGSSGTYGFTQLAGGAVQERTLLGWGHSTYFNKLNYRNSWVPFLKGTAPPAPLSATTGPNWRYRLFLALLLVAILAGLWFAFFRSGAPWSSWLHRRKPAQNATTATTSSPPPLSLPTTVTADDIAGLFVLGFDQSYSSAADIQALVSQLKPGGLLVHRDNIQKRSPGEFAAVMNSIKRGRGDDLDLILAADHEGGEAQLLGKGLEELPSAMALGVLRETDLARRAGAVAGADLARLGLNVNFAPVLDVNVNNQNDLIRDRSFGASSAVVSALGGAFIDGLHSEGVLAVGKHFPGHGHTREGIHAGRECPRSSYSLPELADAITPFRDLSRSFDGVMTSHFSIPRTGSHRLVTHEARYLGLLRATAWADQAPLTYGGPAFTDDLLVACLTQVERRPGRQQPTMVQPTFNAAKRALVAGHDFLVLGRVYPDGEEQQGTKYLEEIRESEVNQVIRLLWEEFASPSASSEGRNRIAEAVARARAFRAGLARRAPGPTTGQGVSTGLAAVFRRSLVWYPEPPNGLRSAWAASRVALIDFEEAARPGAPRQGDPLVASLRQLSPEPRVLRLSGERAGGARETELRAYATRAARIRSELAAGGAADFWTLFVVDSRAELDICVEYLRASENKERVVMIVTAHPNLLSRATAESGFEDLRGESLIAFAFSGKTRWATEIAEAIRDEERGASIDDLPVKIDNLVEAVRSDVR